VEILRRGLRFRIGQAMVVVAYCAVVFAALALWFRVGEFRHPVLQAIILSLVAFAQPHVARILILALGRPTPLRGWFAVQCRNLSDVLLGTAFGLAAIWHAVSGIARFRPVTFTILLGLALLFWAKGLAMVVITCPRFCSRCRRPTLIPAGELRQFLDGFTAHSAGCIACGLVYPQGSSEPPLDAWWSSPGEPRVQGSPR
jgi:hypothetical protein